MKGKVAATLLATLWAAPAQAADTSPQPMAASPVSFTFLQEIIATSNALDGPAAISDTIMHLRGTIDGARDTEIGRFEFSGSGEVFEYRDVDFQSDRYANLQLGYAREFTPDFGLHGSLGYAVKDEGDDIAIGPLVFGVRTASQIFSGGVEAVMRLTPATIASFSVASDYEMVGDSRFTIGLPDLRLLPDRSTTVLGGRLAHQVGNGALSLTARATAVDLHEMQPGFAAIASDRLRLTAGYETVLGAGLEIGAEAGVTYLRDEFELFERAYPVYTLVAAGPAPGGTQLRLSLRGYVDTLDTDDLLAILSAAATIANGGSQIDLDLGVGVPGLASVEVDVAIGEPPQGSSWIAIGEKGATVRTAQTRLRLNVTIGGHGAISLVNLPLYLEVAYGEARLADLNCDSGSVTVAARPGLLEAAIGHVSDRDFEDFNREPVVRRAKLVNLLLTSIEASAHLESGNIRMTDVVFSRSEIDRGEMKTVRTKNIVESLTRSLIERLEVRLLGLDLLGGGLLQKLLAEIIGGVASPLDSLINELLMTLGVGIGEADIKVNGLECGRSVLVQ